MSGSIVTHQRVGRDEDGHKVVVHIAGHEAVQEFGSTYALECWYRDECEECQQPRWRCHTVTTAADAYHPLCSVDLARAVAVLPDTREACAVLTDASKGSMIPGFPVAIESLGEVEEVPMYPLAGR